jgi:Domain of unknown function (DUF4157)
MSGEHQAKTVKTRTAAPAQTKRGPSVGAAPTQVAWGLGNQTVQANLHTALRAGLSSGAVRAKLKVGGANDPEERLADRTADQVMAGRRATPCACGGACDECKNDTVRRKEKAGHAVEGGASLSPVGGRPFDRASRSFFEPRLGRDLSHVQIHTGPQASAQARSIAAVAFTVSNDIVFGEGEYRPGTAHGDWLIAHELAHTMQQRPASEAPIIRRQTSEGQSNDKPPQTANNPDAGAPAPPRPDNPDAGPTSPIKSNQSTNELDEMRGILMKPDQDYLLTQLRKKIAEEGASVPQDFLNQIDYALVNGHWKFLEGPPAPRAEISEDTKKSLNAVRNVATPICNALEKDDTDFLQRFRETVLATARRTLEANREQIQQEAIKYGIHLEPVTTKTSLPGGAEGSEEVSHSPEFKMTEDIGATAGLKEAAKSLFSRRKQIDDLLQQRNNCIHDDTHGNVWFDDEYYQLDQKVHDKEKEYKDLRLVLAGQYPILGGPSALDEGSDALEKVATQEAAGGMAEALGIEIQSKLGKIGTASEALDDPKFSIWQLDRIIALVREEEGVEADPVKVKLLADAERDDTSGTLLPQALLFAFNLLALAFGPVGMAIAAGVNVAVTVSDVQEFIVKDALAHSAFAAEQALSSEDPSLFWLAVEVVGTAVDVGAAVGQVGKAISTFHRFSGLAKAASGAAGEERAAQALAELKTIANSGDHDAAVAARIVRRLESGASKELEATALRKLVSPEEASRLESAAARSERQIAGEVVAEGSVRTTGTVKIDAAGNIWTCRNPCQWVAEKFAAELAADSGAADELSKLREQAADAIGDAEAIKDIEKQSEALVERLARRRVENFIDSLEVLGVNPEARTAEGLRNEFTWQLKDSKFETRVAELETNLKTAAAEAKPDLTALRQIQSDLAALREELGAAKSARIQELESRKALIDMGQSKQKWTGELEAELRGIERPEHPELYEWFMRNEEEGPQLRRVKGRTDVPELQVVEGKIVRKSNVEQVAASLGKIEKMTTGQTQEGIEMAAARERRMRMRDAFRNRMEELMQQQGVSEEELERLVEEGKVADKHPEIAKELESWKYAQHELIKMSESYGEEGARNYMNATFKGVAQPVFAGKGAGQFDQIWKVPKGSIDARTGEVLAEDMYVVIEAKGAGSKLGFRIVEGKAYQQGTRKYFDAIRRQMEQDLAENPMKLFGPEIAKDPVKLALRTRELRETLDALSAGSKVEYTMVKTPVFDKLLQHAADNPEVQQFQW